MLETLKRWAPLTYEAFADYRIGGANISAKGLEAIRRRLQGETITRRDVGMSQSEWNELNALVGNDHSK